MHKHANSQPSNWKVYRKYHKKSGDMTTGTVSSFTDLTHGRSGLTTLQDKMDRSSGLPLLWWHGGGDHLGTKQAKIPVDNTF